MSKEHRLQLSLSGQGRFGKLPAEGSWRRWIKLALESSAQIHLRFVTRPESQALNLQYRQKDKPTNILTFHYEMEPVVVADLVICIPVVRDEAIKYGRSFRDHLAHLVIHGTLHSQGYDHEEPDEAEFMEAREIQLLTTLNIKNPYECIEE